MYTEFLYGYLLRKVQSEYRGAGKIVLIRNLDLSHYGRRTELPRYDVHWRPFV